SRNEAINRADDSTRNGFFDYIACLSAFPWDRFPQGFLFSNATQEKAEITARLRQSVDSEKSTSSPPAMGA
ncbi:MAG: hypothetical protein ACKN94_14005, partial [Pirellulaceae bacterium]